MRALIVIVLLVVLAAIAAVMLGFVHVSQTRPGSLPSVAVRGGQMPAYDVSTANVQIGSKPATVDVPHVDVGVTHKDVQVPTVNVSKP